MTFGVSCTGVSEKDRRSGTESGHSGPEWGSRVRETGFSRRARVSRVGLREKSLGFHSGVVQEGVGKKAAKPPRWGAGGGRRS